MSDIERVKESLNIVDVVSSYVELKPAGSNMKGLCPFHNEKTPSFNVNPTMQIYKCFGCGKGGDVLTFLQEVERLTFPEALEKAADLAGITLEKTNLKKDKKLDEKKKQIIEINNISAKFYNHILKTHKIGKKGREYAQKRGLTAQIIQDFQIGFAPNNKYNLKNYLSKKGYSNSQLLEAGVVIERNGDIIDKFRDRLLQPIFNLGGEVVGFSGRYVGTFEGAPKYLNSSDSLIYQKSKILYGLYNAKESLRKQKYAIIVEGNIDILSAHRIGVKNIVAPLGTAFTVEQAKLLKRFCDKVYFAFDSDTAGVSALIKSLGIVERIGLNHKVIDVRPYSDVDEMIVKDPKTLEKKIKSAKNTIEHLKSIFLENLDLGTVEGKNEFKSKIIPILSLIRDEVEKSHYIQDISLILGIRTDQIEEMLKSSTSYKSVISKEEKESVKELSEEKKTNLEEEIIGYFFQLVQYESNLVFDFSFIKNEMLQEILTILMETQGDISDEILNMLDDSTKELLTTSIKKTIDKDLSLEMLKLKLKRLFFALLDMEYSELRQKLHAYPDDENLYKDLQSYAAKKRYVERMV